MTLRSRPSLALLIGLLAGSCSPASGQGHEAVLIADPASAESLYVANVYAQARGLPSSNLLFFSPAAPTFAQLAEVNHAALFGELQRKRISRADYILLTSDQPFSVAASGLVSDQCSAVNRFALASSYGLAPFAGIILAGGQNSTIINPFAGASSIAFNAQTQYLSGNPVSSGGRRSFIAAHIGYTGTRGNTLGEVLETITRGVASDFTNPTAEMQMARTSDVNRSGPRDGGYAATVNLINSEGGNASTFNANLPRNGDAVAGAMTGLANPDIDGGDFTIVPGAYADHLTSFAGAFNIDDQTKMSRWIAKGATLTSGAVEEPCNYPSKFPSSRVFLHATRGLTLGESYYRAAGAVPFQIMLMGDPLARPFGIAPVVSLPDLPSGPISSRLAFTPLATTARPGAGIERVDVFVDGIARGSYAPGERVELSTSFYGDGFRELRVVAIDDTDQEIPGEWVGLIELTTRGGSASLSVDSASGALNDTFAFTLDAPTRANAVVEARLLHHGRVVATSDTVPATLSLHGQILGAGPAPVVAEMLYSDGSSARSAPVVLDIAFDASTPSDNAPPVAYGYTRSLRLDDDTFVLELPADHSDDPSEPSYRIVTPPSGATLISSGGFEGDGPYRVFRRTGAGTSDSLVFEITDSQGRSSQATIHLSYAGIFDEFCFADQNFDGQVNGLDFGAWLSGFNAGSFFADVNQDGAVNGLDFGAWLSAFNAGCDF